MSRIAVPGFVGPSNLLRSRNADCERTINLYVESTAPGQGKVHSGLYGTPGLRIFAQVSDTPGSGIFVQDDHCFAVVGTSFVQLSSAGDVTTWGTVTAATTDLPTSMVSNGTAGNQLLIVSGGDGFVFNFGSHALTEITDGNFPGTAFPAGNALQCEFMDGYGLVVQAETRRFYFSALEDFTSWDALDVAERSEASDNLVGFKRSHRDLWFLGNRTGEVWFDQGDVDTPFAPIQGVFLETGAISPFLVRLGNEIAWLGQDERGSGCVYLSQGFTPTRISTSAVERDLQSSSDLSAAWLFAQQQQGHLFLWITVPDLQTSWVYDLTTQLWHERALWNPLTCLFEPHLASSYAFAFGKHLVTDRDSGVIYELDLSVYDDRIVT